jgi:formate hydrogenlyase subunit 6/NADH:ubiquinone oxidoreductase subunit I
VISLIPNLIKNLLNKPATRLYPFEKREPFEATRGHIDMDPNVCIYCGICAKRCPTNAISVTKEPKDWTVDPYQCIVCNYCVEVCPKKCITMHRQYTTPVP